MVKISTLPEITDLAATDRALVDTPAGARRMSADNFGRAVAVQSVAARDATRKLFDDAADILPRHLARETGWLYRFRLGRRLLAGFRPDGTFEPVLFRAPVASIHLAALAQAVQERMLGGAIGTMLRALSPEAATGFRLRIGKRLYATVDPVAGVYLRKARLAASTSLDDQPGVPLVNRLAGSFAARVNPRYVLVTVIDAAGNRQFHTRRRTDGKLTAITTAGNNSDAVLTDDDRVLYYAGATGIVMQRPADASDIARPIAPTDVIMLLGDSMIENGNAGIGDELVALYPARLVVSQGIGGQWTRLAAARFGAEPVTVTVQGGVIPTSGSVTVVPDIDFLRIGSDNQDICCRVMIAGVPGTLLRNGLTNSPTYRFTPTVYPAAPVAAGGAQPLTVMSATARNTTDASGATSIEVMRAGVLIVRLGKNDTDRPDYDQAATIARIRAIVARMTGLWRHVIVLGVTNGPGQVPTSAGGMNGSITAANARLSLQRVADINTALAAAFPDTFLDPQATHVAAGGSSRITVDGATFDVLTATTCPDGTHEGPGTPQNRTAALIQATMTAKGY